MKQYKKFMPYCLRVLMLLLVGHLPVIATAQSVPDPRWYFGNSPEWISFLTASASLEQGQLPIGFGGSVVATDYRSGRLLFYAGGERVVNAAGATSVLNGNPSMPQPVHAVPAPGLADTYYLFVITAAGTLEYRPYNYVTNTLGAATTLDIGGNTPTGAMELIKGSSQNGFVYWLVVPLVPQNGVTSFSLIKIGGATPVPTTFSVSEFPFPITVSAMAFSEEKGLLAVGGALSTDPAPVMLFSFDRSNPASGPDFDRLQAVDTLATLTAQNGGISGLAWKGDYLLAAKRQNAAAGTTGSVYRFEVNADFRDTPLAEIIPGTSFFQNLDLKTAPDGRVYHLYRPQAGGPIQVGYISNAGTDTPDFVPTSAPFGTVDFAGAYFNAAAPPPQRNYNIDFDYVNACTGTTTYFYPEFAEEVPERVEWRRADGTVFSTQLQPVVDGLFTSATTEPITLTAYYPDGVVEVTEAVTVSQGYTVEVQQEIILCPGESKTVGTDPNSDFPLTVKDANGQQANIPGMTVTWFKPRSTSSPNNPEVVNDITITADSVLNPLTNQYYFPDAGTYYAVISGQGINCQIYASFAVRIYNDDWSKLNLWYFGDGAELDFSGGVPSPLTQYPNPMSAAPEGVSLVVDANVDPLFSTNGENLWVPDFVGGTEDDIAPNGTAIGGSRDVTQNSLFEPFLADPSLYYLFTISGNADNRSLRYTVADLKGNAGAPVASSDVEQAASGDFIKGRLLQDTVAEKLISISGDSSRIWVITHGLGNNRFYSFPITVDGIGVPVTSSAGTVYTANEAKGYLTASTDGTLLAAAVGNAVEVYHFDKETGQVLPDGYVTISPSGIPGPVYGVAFSPSDERLYFTAGGKLYQASLDSLLTQEYVDRSLLEVASADPNAGSPGTLGAIQLAPNNQLYIAREGAMQLASITSPDDTATTYSPDGLQNPLNGTSRMGLPNLRRMAGDSPQEPSVAAETVCFGEKVVAKGTNRYSNEEYKFNLEEFVNNTWQPVTPPSPAFQEADSIEYENLPVGRYRVRLELRGCDIIYPTAYPNAEPVIAEFNVNPIPEVTVSNAEPITLCEDQSVTLNGQVMLNGQAANPSEFDFIWTDNNGVVIGTSPDLEVTELGAYTLTAISKNPEIVGCEAAPFQVFVGDQRPEADLGDDITVCAGESLPAELNGNVAGVYDIRWLRSINGGPFADLNNTTAVQSLSDINTSQAANYRYVIEVRPQDAGATCFRADTVAINIALTPTVELWPTGNTCSGSTELVAEAEDGSGNYSFEFFREGVSIGPGSNGSIVVTTSGTYTVTATDLNGNCSATSAPVTIDVNNGIQDIAIDAEPGCRVDDSPATNRLTARTSYVGSVTFVWERLENGNWVVLQNRTNASEYFRDGTYRVTATAGASCQGAQATSEPVEVIGVLTPSLVVQPFYAICPEIETRSTATITLEGNYRGIVWTNKATGDTLSNLSIFTTNVPGEYQVRVEGCQDPATFTVSVDCTPSLYLPNAIRVGSTNTGNRGFSILNQEMRDNIDEIEVLIFNRWGEVINRFEEADFTWMGHNESGYLVPMGNYPYLIRYTNKYGEDKEVKKIYGSVFVMY